MSEINLQDHIRVYKALFENMWVFRDHWRQVQQFTDPYAGRNLWGLRDPYEDLGMRKDQWRINAGPWLAKNELVAGFSEGMTPRDRPFFAFRLPDDDLMEDNDIQEWLFACRNNCLDLMERSGFYDEMKVLYGELAVFGSANMMIYSDPVAGAICKTDTIGEFVYGLGKYGKIERTYRRKVMTVRSIIAEFGIDNVPDSIRQMNTEKTLDKEWMVVHAITPSNLFTPGAVGKAGMNYDSFSFIENQVGSQQDPMDAGNAIMHKEGFKMKPNLTPRWGVTGGQVYGTSPVMQVLGDIKQVQKLESKKLLGLDKTIDPPMLAPESLRAVGIRVGPGQTNYYAAPMAPEQVAPVYNLNFNIKDTSEEIVNVMQRVDRALFRDVFQAMTQLGQLSPDATAYLSSRVWEEKMARIGPAVDMIENEVLRPAIDRFFQIAFDHGMLSPPLMAPPPRALPPGMPIKVEYTSFLSQAKRQIGMSSIQQALSFTTQQAQIKPGAVMIWNDEEAQREVNKSLGINPKLLFSKDELNALKKQAAQQAAEQQAVASAQPIAGAVQKLSQAKVGNQSALEHLVGGKGKAA